MQGQDNNKIEPALQMTFRFSILILFLTLCSAITWAQEKQNGKYTEINQALKKPKDVIELQLSGITEPLPALDKFVNLKVRAAKIRQQRGTKM